MEKIYNFLLFGQFNLASFIYSVNAFAIKNKKSMKPGFMYIFAKFSFFFLMWI